MIVDGIHRAATYKSAHPRRVGGVIEPRAVVVHTTDMLPNTFNGLVRAWSTTPGQGACAHFIIGRDATQGLVQMVPVNHNANHAGGKYHGSWERGKDLPAYHPNRVSVGIELHAAGRLEWYNADKGAGVYKSGGKVLAAFRDDELYTDNLGRPWHVVTPWQLETLAHLLRDLRQVMKPLTATPKPFVPYDRSGGRWDTSYAKPTSRFLVGHASLSPNNKSDPGPQVMQFINEFAVKEGWT